MAQRSTAATLLLGGLVLVSLLFNFFLFNRLAALEDQIEEASRTARAAQAEVATMQAATSGAAEEAAQALEAASGAQNRINGAFILMGLALEDVASQLELLETQSFTITVPIQTEVPVAATIPFDEVFEVPVNTTIPIRTTVVVPLRLGVLGSFDLDVPISTDVPLDLSVPVRIQKEVPIRTTVPINLDVPVTLSLEDTPLAAQLSQWRADLLALLADFPQSGAP